MNGVECTSLASQCLHGATTNVRLAGRRATVSVKGVASNRTLDVPSGVAADIQVAAGLASNNIDLARFNGWVMATTAHPTMASCRTAWRSASSWGGRI